MALNLSFNGDTQINDVINDNLDGLTEGFDLEATDAETLLTGIVADIRTMLEDLFATAEEDEQDLTGTSIDGDTIINVVADSEDVGEMRPTFNLVFAGPELTVDMVVAEIEPAVRTSVEAFFAFLSEKGEDVTASDVAEYLSK